MGIRNKLPPADKIRKGGSLIGELLFLTALFMFGGQLAMSNASPELKLAGYIVLAGAVIVYSEAKLAYHRFITKLEKTADDLEELSESLESISETVEEVQKRSQNEFNHKDNKDNE